MARDVRLIWTCKAGSTAANKNGGGFNPYNANFPTDLATTTGTSATPTVSGAYAFTENDATFGAWVYVAAGTNWIQGFYQITGVNGGVATLNAAIGAASVWDAVTGSFVLNTVQGCCTQSTPGGNATYGVDYSQGNSSPWQALTDLSCAAGTTNPSVVTSATIGTWPTALLGNVIHVTAGTNWTVNGSTGQANSWYEIVSISGTSATLSDNQAVGSAVDLTTNKGTFYIGGAFSLNSSTANMTDDSVFELGAGTNGTGASIFYFNGALTFATAPSMTAAGGTQALIKMIGYNAVRGDAPTGTNRPSISHGGFTWTFAANISIAHTIHTGSATGLIASGTSARIYNCKGTNTSTTSTRTPFNGSSDTVFLNCEAVSYRGRGIDLGGAGNIASGCYVHDSDIGIFLTTGSNACTITFNIIESCVTAAISGDSSAAETGIAVIASNTLFGSLNTTGTGLLLVTGQTDVFFLNNIVSYFTTGIVSPDVQSGGISFDDYNNYYGNDVDVSATAGGALDYTRWQKGPHDIAVNPLFVSVGQVTTTAAVILSGNRIQDSSKDFTALGVVAGLDFVYYHTGSGAGVKGIYGISAITTVTNPNDTLTVDLTLTADATTDHQIQITTGHNFLPTATQSTIAGFPGAFQAGLSTGNLGMGAVMMAVGGGGGRGIIGGGL